MTMVRAAAVGAFLTAGLVGLAAQSADIEFVNRTGVTIFFLYASASTSDTWGEDLLGESVLGDGQSVTVRLRSISGAFDVRAVDSEDREYIIWAVPRAQRRVEIGRDVAVVGIASGQNPEALSWFHLVNDTGYTIVEAYARRAGEQGWDRAVELLPEDRVIRNGERYRIHVDVGRVETFVVDVLLVDVDGDRYLRLDVDLELVTEVVFTLDDIVW